MFWAKKWMWNVHHPLACTCTKYRHPIWPLPDHIFVGVISILRRNCCHLDVQRNLFSQFTPLTWLSFKQNISSHFQSRYFHIYSSFEFTWVTPKTLINFRFLYLVQCTPAAWLIVDGRWITYKISNKCTLYRYLLGAVGRNSSPSQRQSKNKRLKIITRVVRFHYYRQEHCCRRWCFVVEI